jgi:hypothetical protein
MSNYQRTERFAAALSRLPDLFSAYDLLTRRRHSRFTPLPDEKGDQMAAEAAAEVMRFGRAVEETGDAALRFIAEQGLDSLLVQYWLQVLVLDLREIHGGIGCANRSWQQLAHVQTIVSHALLLGKPAGSDRMTAEQADERAFQLLKTDRAFRTDSDSEQARKIGCHPNTWKKTPCYQTLKRRKAQQIKTRQDGPHVESLSEGVEAQQRVREYHRLVDEQKQDMAQDPSPLEPDPPGRPKRARQRKQL